MIDFGHMKKGQKLTIRGEHFWFISYLTPSKKLGWKVLKKDGKLTTVWFGDREATYQEVLEDWHGNGWRNTETGKNDHRNGKDDRITGSTLPSARSNGKEDEQ